MAADSGLAGLGLGAASAAPAAFHMTTGVIWKTLGSLVLSVLGMYYLNRGRKESDLGAMLKGAVLILLSFFLFF
ncbi:MAG: hypothetical protein KGO96_10980 [Elusimicrobia bacterium]|nr:hypothetical protein [Elusimicrobiota bacterium]MDE2236983.1 hypothetical protein [Elusimicrobiota bacterium]MDE2426416.1 hypothetical protein [Elusimicrobiota bacterium]